MEPKTKVIAEDGRQDLTIIRDFDLPVEALFRAHVEPALLEQWMGSKAVVFETRKHGSWRLEKKDEQGNPLFGAGGVFHEFIANQKITRTFEMDNAPFDAQLEFLVFESLGEGTSRLTMQSIYKSGALRDQQLKMPFAQGINWAHNRLQEIVSQII